MSDLETVSGRTIKFTPERLEQIKNLVERGMDREQIAELIGVTVGSLQVTCSNKGISLRRIRVDNEVQPTKEVKVTESGSGDDFRVTMTFQYKGRSKTIEVPLSRDTFAHLIVAAEVDNKDVGDEIAAIIKRTISGPNGA